MSAHHVDLPEQVVTPGEELWVKIIDLDLQRRRISLSIKQAAEGGEVAEEYREHFGEHAYDAEGNYIGPVTDPNYDPSEVEAAWSEYYGGQTPPPAEPVADPDSADVAEPDVAADDAEAGPADEAGEAGAETE
jgi:small subunit ribosomal protein S1